MKNVFHKKRYEKNVFRKHSSSHLLFRKIFFIIQKLFMKNVFYKAFHTPHNPFGIRFPESYFLDMNTTTTLYLLCTLYVMRKQKSLTFHSRWCCRKGFLCSIHHHGYRITSTPLNSFHCIIFFLNILAFDIMISWRDEKGKCEDAVSNCLTLAQL